MDGGPVVALRCCCWDFGDRPAGGITWQPANSDATWAPAGDEPCEPSGWIGVVGPSPPASEGGAPAAAAPGGPSDGRFGMSVGIPTSGPPALLLPAWGGTAVELALPIGLVAVDDARLRSFGVGIPSGGECMPP